MVTTKVANSRATTARRKNIKSAFKKIGQIAASQGGKLRTFPSDNHSPIILGRRVVLRSQLQVPVKMFVALHKLYKEDSIRATSILNSNMGDKNSEPTRRINVALRCAIQELWEDRLKTTGQILGIFPPDPELTLPAQILFEQFWKAHGYPNDAEKDLLEQVGYVDAAIVDAWFLLKDCRLRTYRLMQELMKVIMLNSLLGEKNWRHIVKRELKIKKPFTRH